MGDFQNKFESRISMSNPVAFNAFLFGTLSEVKRRYYPHYRDDTIEILECGDNKCTDQEVYDLIIPKLGWYGYRITVKHIFLS